MVRVSAVRQGFSRKDRRGKRWISTSKIHWALDLLEPLIEAAHRPHRPCHRLANRVELTLKDDIRRAWSEELNQFFSGYALAIDLLIACVMNTYIPKVRVGQNCFR